MAHLLCILVVQNFIVIYENCTGGQVLGDMLGACIIEFEASWERYLPLVEFFYNNSFQSSIQMAPYGTLYGRRC
ncbi:Gag protease polyprotein [Gossypium australe]|uniref:Gag protease polyprotein n=1 Tax=Gossypium australe TaxID=47621 RepID=A0A5B6W8Q9_9ROSI|nr:Gag protease polyprotein [Gossypium australe]